MLPSCRMAICARPKRVGEEVAGELALSVVPADQPEDVLAALLGQARMGRERRDHQDVRGLVNAGGEQRRMRAQMPDDEAHTRPRPAARGVHRLCRPQASSAATRLHLLAEHAAARVKILDRHLDRERLRSPVGKGPLRGLAKPIWISASAACPGRSPPAPSRRSGTIAVAWSLSRRDPADRPRLGPEARTRHWPAPEAQCAKCLRRMWG